MTKMEKNQYCPWRITESVDAVLKFKKAFLNNWQIGRLSYWKGAHPRAATVSLLETDAFGWHKSLEHLRVEESGATIPLVLLAAIISARIALLKQEKS